MTKIIAEIGVNWCGDIRIAKEMILSSKRAGADYVKFQMFNEYIIINSKYKSELSEMILDYSKLSELAQCASINNIGFGVTPMYLEAFDIIEKVSTQINFLKIRCSDRCNKKISRPAVKYCGKHNIPLLVSTDRYVIEYEDYCEYNLCNTNHINYLYCIPEYPPELKQIYLHYISSSCFDGYSNHFPSKYLPMIAVSKNLEFVEIHVKRKTHNSVAVLEGLENEQIDANVSIDFNDLREVCELRDIIAKLA